MVNLLPTKSPKQTFDSTELLPTHESFIKKYWLVVVLLIAVLITAIASFGSIIYRTGSDLLASRQRKPVEQKKPVEKTVTRLELATGFTLSHDSEWETIVITNEPEAVEIIASAAYNATRIEISSYSKNYPKWEEQVNLAYFDVDDETSREIGEFDVKITTGKDASLYAKVGYWETETKVLEIRVFSANKQTTNSIFDKVAKSVKETQQVENARELAEPEDATQDTQSLEDLDDTTNQSSSPSDLE